MADDSIRSVPLAEINDDFRRRILAWLEETERSQSWLAHRVGVTPQGLSRILEPAKKAERAGRSPVKFSRYAAAISAVTGIPLPHRDLPPIVAEGFTHMQTLAIMDVAFLRRVVTHMR